MSKARESLLMTVVCMIWAQTSSELWAAICPIILSIMFGVEMAYYLIKEHKD